MAEAWVATFNSELVEEHVFASLDIARLRIFDYIEAFYNPRRRHSPIRGQSPDDNEQLFLDRQQNRQLIQ